MEFLVKCAFGGAIIGTGLAMLNPENKFMIKDNKHNAKGQRFAGVVQVAAGTFFAVDALIKQINR